MAEGEERKRILYVAEEDSKFRHCHVVIESEGRPYEGLFYWELRDKLSRGALKHTEASVVDLHVIYRILGMYRESLDLIVAEGWINNDIGLPIVRQTSMTEADIVVCPIDKMVGGKFESEAEYWAENVKASGADFGILDSVKGEKFVKAIDDIFAGRVGGFYFNPYYYEEVDGRIVAKDVLR